MLLRNFLFFLQIVMKIKLSAYVRTFWYFILIFVIYFDFDNVMKHNVEAKHVNLMLKIEHSFPKIQGSLFDHFTWNNASLHFKTF